MKPSPECSGLQGSNDPTHTSYERRRIIRRIIRHKINPNQRSSENLPKSTIGLSSLGRPDHDQSNGTHTDARNLIPTILHEGDGRNDKIRLHCEICNVTFAHEDDARDFIFRLGGPPANQRTDREQFSRLFTIAPRQGLAHRLKIRSKPFAFGGDMLQPPLFSGQLIFRRFRRDDGKIAISITADLFLNVNRALNYQRAKLARRQDGVIFKSLNPIQRLPPSADNVAPLVLRPKEHDKARAEYIKQVMAALLADVQRAARVSDASGSRAIIVAGTPKGFSLREVETCWDIGGAGLDASRVLDSITPAVREWGGRRGWEGNQGNITTLFSDSERLVVYAKADNRLRFEIRHRPTQGKKSYTAQSIIGLIGRMNEFRHMAAQRVNRLLGPLRARLTPPVRQPDWTAYALEWGACCGNCNSSKAILGMLMRERRIFGGKYLAHIPRWEKIRRKACARGLLRFENGAYHATMTEGEESGFTTFDNPASFPGHNTETQPACVSPNSPTPRRLFRERIGIPPSPPIW